MNYEEEKQENINKLIKSIKNLKVQREIINSFDEILKITPEVVESFDEFYYQRYADRKYNIDTLKNALKSSMSSIISLKISESIINSNLDIEQVAIITFIGAITGWVLFQTETAKEYRIASLNKNEVKTSYYLSQNKLNNIINDFIPVFEKYIELNGNSKYLNIKQVFDKNNKYIQKQKENKELSHNFSYENIIKSFEEILGENGLENYLETIYYVITENTNDTNQENLEYKKKIR